MITTTKRHRHRSTSSIRSAQQQKTDIMMMSFQLAKKTDRLKPLVMCAAGAWILGSVGLIIGLLILLGNMFSLFTINPGIIFIISGVLLVLMFVIIIIAGMLWKHQQITGVIKQLIACDSSKDFRHLTEYFTNQPALRHNDQANNLLVSLLHFADGQTHLLDMTNVIILMSRLSPTQVPIHKGRDSHK